MTEPRARTIRDRLESIVRMTAAAMGEIDEGPYGEEVVRNPDYFRDCLGDVEINLEEVLQRLDRMLAADREEQARLRAVAQKYARHYGAKLVGFVEGARACDQRAGTRNFLDVLESCGLARRTREEWPGSRSRRRRYVAWWLTDEGRATRVEWELRHSPAAKQLEKERAARAKREVAS